MHSAAAFAVAPARGDDRAGDHAGILVACPADRVEELLRAIRLPVGEQQFRGGGHGMDDLAAQNTMLTIPRFEIAIRAERARRDAGWQGLAQVVAIASKSGIENRNLDALPPEAECVPTINAEPSYVFLPRLPLLRGKELAAVLQGTRPNARGCQRRIRSVKDKHGEAKSDQASTNRPR